MPTITPFLWFDYNAEEAIAFYISIFKDGKILDEHRHDDGKLFFGSFQIHGQKLMALNGGPDFKFTEAISLFVDCDTQEEVDYLWDKLVEGGRPVQCGWLQDKYGLFWQIIPSALGELLGDPDPEKSGRVMQAMLKMVKIDVEGLRRAYENRAG